MVDVVVPHSFASRVTRFRAENGCCEDKTSGKDIKMGCIEDSPSCDVAFIDNVCVWNDVQ